MPLDREQVLAALRGVEEPELRQDVVSLNMVKGIRVEGDAAFVHIELRSPNSDTKELLGRNVEAALRRAGAGQVRIDWSAGDSGGGGGGASRAAAPPPRNNVLPQVKNVIAVGAGKGGVGKSTVALNLAVGLRRAGSAVGLMDGDIYGPSMPTMLGIRGVPPPVRGNKILPHHVHGLHAITIGSLVEQDKPLIWRGPMAHGAFKQLLSDNTEWPELDYLVVDLPPGTGDVPLTLCQLLPLTGAVVVATPQQVALDDAIRAVRMFQQLGVPVLGMVENMSYFIDPAGQEHDIFGRGGTEKAAQRLGLPYLGAIPMFTELRVNSDAGQPHANFEGNSRLAEALGQVVGNLAGQVSLRSLQPAGPQFTIS